VGPGTVALALIQPAGLPALWSGAGVFDRIRTAMFHRYEDVYFRPLAQAESIAGLRWRTAKFRWLFAAESGASSLSLFALWPNRWGKPMAAGDIDEAYAYFQQRLATSGFSEETAANIDYALYTTMRLVHSFQPPSANPTGEFAWRTLSRLLEAASVSNLYMGAVMVATLEPSMIKNPLVLREIARTATKAADAYLLAAGELGLTSV
jgi:hypothetical protein